MKQHRILQLLPIDICKGKGIVTPRIVQKNTIGSRYCNHCGIRGPLPLHCNDSICRTVFPVNIGQNLTKFIHPGLRHQTDLCTKQTHRQPSIGNCATAADTDTFHLDQTPRHQHIPDPPTAPTARKYRCNIQTRMPGRHHFLFYFHVFAPRFSLFPSTARISVF